MRPSYSRVFAYALVLAATAAGMTYWLVAAADKAPPTPNYFRSGGVGALEAYEQQADWFQRTTLRRHCKPDERRMRLLVTSAFGSSYHMEIDNVRLVHAEWRLRADGPHLQRYPDLVETQRTVLLEAGEASSFWERIDDDFLDLPSIDATEPDPIDGWFVSLEVCRDGHHAFFHRSSPDRAAVDAPLLDLVEYLETLTPQPPATRGWQ